MIKKSDRKTEEKIMKALLKSNTGDKDEQMMLVKQLEDMYQK